MGGELPSFGQLGRGSYLLKALTDCGGCHTADPTKVFGGGNKFPIDAEGHFVYSRNLTSDPTTGMTLTEEQFIEVMRTGADFHNPGQVLLVMPWPNYRWMTTDDLKAIYQVLKFLPPVVNAVPNDDKGVAALGTPVPFPSDYNDGEETRRLPAETSQVPLGPPNTQTPIPDPGNAVRGAAIHPLSYAKMPNFFKRTAAEQASFGRGSYLATAAACNDCHTNKDGLSRSFTPGPDFLRVPADAYLTGGTVFAVPPPLNPVLKQTRTMGSNLIGSSGFFNEPDMTFLLFAEIIQTMTHADDTPPLGIGWPMPADHFRNLSESDLLDIYTYMKILAEDYDHTGQLDKITQDQARYCTTSAECANGETCFVDASADKVVNNQCVGKSCSSDDDCDACQTCDSGACAAPSPAAACLSKGR